MSRLTFIFLFMLSTTLFATERYITFYPSELIDANGNVTVEYPQKNSTNTRIFSLGLTYDHNNYSGSPSSGVSNYTQNYITISPGISFVHYDPKDVFTLYTKNSGTLSMLYSNNSYDRTDRINRVASLKLSRKMGIQIPFYKSLLFGAEISLIQFEVSYSHQKHYSVRDRSASANLSILDSFQLFTKIPF